MNKKNLELFGLNETATKEDVTAAYEQLRAKYLEERFMDGEIGNNAAKMLTQIEVAYNDLMREFSESATADGSDSSFTKVEELIRLGNLQEAQRVLDGFNERGGRWHYLQSVIFFRKNWVNESKKQLEIAIQLEPNNDKYKETYRKLNEKLNYDANNGGQNGANQSVYQGQTMNSGADDQMGGNFCSYCIKLCYLNLCLNCMCELCCNCN